MKKLTLILTIIMMTTTSMMAERVTPETARKVAAAFLNNNGAKSDHLTDLSKEAGFDNLYIFNAGQGFVIIAAEDCVKPILGYSLTKKFEVEGLPDNIYNWLKGYNDAIQHTIKNQLKASGKTAQLWKELSESKTGVAEVEEIVSALVKTQWDQGSPYNNLCPGVTGCVATAMAQIMKYWEYPKHGIGSYSYTCNNQNLTADFASTHYDWEHMINSYSGPSEQVEKQAVATLMYHCGVSVNMQYGWDESSASTFDVVSALKSYFNYSPNISYEYRSDYDDVAWITLLKAELDNDRPIQYRGASSEGGHSFICDGYDSEDLFHFNWGWGGRDDGFYDIDIMGTSLGSYTIGQAAVIGIEPVHCNADDPYNLIISQDGRHISLSWSPADGAASYNIYRDGSLIGNSTTNTYEDVSAPFGIITYYVRSMDSEGNLSLASNIVSTTVNYNTDGMVVDGLQLKYENGASSLQWASPARLQYLDYFTFLGNVYYTGDFDKWAARFPASSLSTYSGLSVNSVASYFYSDGQYTAKLYQCTGTYPSGDAIASVTQTLEKGWHTITFDIPQPLDISKDLWVVFECPGIYLSTIIGAQPSENGNWLYYRGAWEQFNGYTFFISAYLTDGNFTYSLYRNDEMIAEDLVNNVYSDDAPINNSANLYTVRINNSGAESTPSNMAGIAIGTATLDEDLTIGENDKLTIIENSSLTVSGNLICNDPDHLILKDGAQLINGSEGVKATVKKAIQPFTEGLDNGWNLIASPVTDSLDADNDVYGLIKGTYDLYSFDQSGTDESGNTKEWRNYKAESFTTIDHKAGYLYANSDETTISFAGTLAGTTEPTTITRDDNVDFKGFNLIGNPYPCNVYTNQPFYILQYNEDDDKTSFVLGENPIPPCAAILVQAQTAEESVTFSKSPLAKQASIAMQLSKSNTRSTRHIDQARISFEAGCQLSKYTWDDASSTIYIPQNGQNFAVAYANDANEMPININVVQNGTYTVSFEIDNLNLNYLHLIDNLTGADVDLLATPKYTFEGKTTDYASRFRLVFICEDKNNDNETFAYYANGEIVINDVVETHGHASLQIIDMMGRIITSRVGRIQCVPTNGMTAGVYVLRLINGNDVKTQKIVIE